MSGDADKPKIIIKKKKGGHGGAHGGAWKVAYADFVTAMMALFMVLWLLTQADLKLRTQIAQYFRDPGVLSGAAMVGEQANDAKSRNPTVVTKDIIVVQGKAEQELLESQAHEIEKALAGAAKDNPDLAALKDEVDVQVTDQGLVITVIDKGKNLLFDVSSSELKPGLVKLLSAIAPILEKLPNGIQVGGHTDGRPYPPGSAKSNWDLSFERADKARRVLEDHGLSRGHVKRVLAYADTEPLVPENPLADENRRLSILAQRTNAAPGPQTAACPEAVVLPPDSLPPPQTASAPTAPPPPH